MSVIPEFTIFRKFAVLNRLNLLRLQAELQVLEEELIELQIEDETSSDPERQDLAFDFQAMRESEGGANKFQLEKLEAISRALKEYNDALIQVSTIDKLPTANPVQLREYDKWLSKRRECGANFPRDWENPYAERWMGDHLTFMDTNPEHDPVTSFLEGPIINLVHRIRGRPREMPVDGVARYSDRAIDRSTRAVSAAISSLLPTSCVIVLYFVPRLIVRLGLMVLFTAMFAMALAFFTSGKKHEIFSATAAFAAVEVVFIGSTHFVGDGEM